MAVHKVFHGSLNPNIIGPLKQLSHFSFTELPAQIVIANLLFLDEEVGVPTIYDCELDIDLAGDVEDITHINCRTKQEVLWEPSKKWLRLADVYSPKAFQLARVWRDLRGGDRRYYETAGNEITKIMRTNKEEDREPAYANWMLGEMTKAGVLGYVYTNAVESEEAICIADPTLVKIIGKRGFTKSEIASVFIKTPIDVNKMGEGQYNEALKNAKKVL
jgi:hypothetical protein